MKYISKTGIIFVVILLVIVGLFLWDDHTCTPAYPSNENTCGMGIILVILPFALVYEATLAKISPINFTSDMQVIIVSVLFECLLVYILGNLIELSVKRLLKIHEKNRRNT